MKYVYEGEVRLLCQEGGFAHPAIELSEQSTEEIPKDVTHESSYSSMVVIDEYWLSKTYPKPKVSK